MIHSLEIENFMSVRDRQVIDLTVGSAVSDFPERYAETWPGSGQRVPKVVALFGANAAGKSTVLRTLQYLAWFVRDSFQFNAGNSLPFEPFWDDVSQNEPSRLAIEFAGPESFAGTSSSGTLIAGTPLCRYMYELRLQTVDGRRTVLGESLFFWPSRAKRRLRLFERDGSGNVVAAKEFELFSQHTVLKKILRDNASVVSTLAQLAHEPSLALQKAATQFTSNIFVEKLQVNEIAMVQFYQANPSILESVNRDIGSVDLGIRSMSIQQGNAGPMATFKHEGLSRDVPLVMESHGTRQFLQIYPYLAKVLQDGGIAVMDELDLAIHPKVLPEILRWFYSRERNPYLAQLWMTCQNASLLEDLSKDEVFFCEKGASGSTSIYGLKEIQGVRRADNFYRKYMGGTYGAVPTIG